MYNNYYYLHLKLIIAPHRRGQTRHAVELVQTTLKILFNHVIQQKSYKSGNDHPGAQFAVALLTKQFLHFSAQDVLTKSQYEQTALTLLYGEAGSSMRVTRQLIQQIEAKATKLENEARAAEQYSHPELLNQLYTTITEPAIAEVAEPEKSSCFCFRRRGHS